MMQGQKNIVFFYFFCPYTTKTNLIEIISVFFI